MHAQQRRPSAARQAFKASLQPQKPQQQPRRPRQPASNNADAADDNNKRLLQRAASLVAAAAVALAASLGGLQPPLPPPAQAAPALSAADTEYERQLTRLRKVAAVQHPAPSTSTSGGGGLPSAREAAALRLLSADRELFSDDAWQGMLGLQRYAEFVERQVAAGAEAAPGCGECLQHRQMLERAWQTVSTEFYDPTGRFTQAGFAARLLDVLQEAPGGVLRTRRDAYAALHRLVDGLGDPYSAFLEPTAFRTALRRPLPAERAYLAAQLVGVGLQLGPPAEGGGRVVLAPLVESPAEAAGVRAGDRVLEIDGLPAAALTLDESVALLRGPAGSTVTVVVAPGGGGRGALPPRTLDLERRPLPQPALRGAQLPLPDGRHVEYVRLHFFSHEATTLLRDLVRAAEAEGARTAGYIVDLRNDPGGTFEEAVAIASLFEDPRATVAQTVRGGGAQVDAVWRPVGLSQSAWPDLAAGPLTGRPVVLLVNRSTASASEVLAGALRDHGRALLLGERTFGKGVVQYFFPLGDGSGLKLTAAKYLTPSSYDITMRGGLQPDIVCHDHPHGVIGPSKGPADKCVVAAMQQVLDAAAPPDPLSYEPLLASVGGDE